MRWIQAHAGFTISSLHTELRVIELTGYRFYSVNHELRNGYSYTRERIVQKYMRHPVQEIIHATQNYILI